MTSLGENGSEFETLFRKEWGRIVAVLARLLGDLDRAEECAQAALVEAVERWPINGAPSNPGAWLMTTARNRALDGLRRDRRRRGQSDSLAAHETGLRAESQLLADRSAADQAYASDPDDWDALRLIFICCHPALVREARVALTLRMVGGLSTGEIAAAFATSESTTAQRLVRAKRAIRDRRLAYRVPEAAELPERLPAVLDVVYLIFNAGYEAHESESLIRSDLCKDAAHLGRMLAAALPREAEVLGLLALIEFQSSRFDTRVDSKGDLVLLEDQDRSRWDRVRIERARRLLVRAKEARGTLRADRFELQARIAEQHAITPRHAETDWRAIEALYDELGQAAPSPFVELNAIVAHAMSAGFGPAFARLDTLGREHPIRDHRLFAATRADFQRRLGRNEAAAVDYRRAIDATTNASERRFLEGRLAACVATIAAD